jgi:predicted nucleotidyltransferase
VTERDEGIAMFSHERDSLLRISTELRERFAGRIEGLYAFGSRVRGDHHGWSDFDVLVIVRDRDPAIEASIVAVFVEEELRTGLGYAPVIKDFEAFERERIFHTPFHENITREGIPL